jgi:hypothetical protein
MVITDKDLEKLAGKFLTKEDSKRFATKEDLKQFATKEDLKQFATRDEVLTRLDRVLAEQEKAREDRIFAKAKDDEPSRGGQARSTA